MSNSGRGASLASGSRWIKIKILKMVVAMKCLICVGCAQRIQCHGPWEERDCPDWGRYRISDELILALMDQGQIFDISKTRDLLTTRRLEDASAIPTIEIHEALLVP
jgi:hypothetical protein